MLHHQQHHAPPPSALSAASPARLGISSSSPNPLPKTPPLPPSSSSSSTPPPPPPSTTTTTTTNLLSLLPPLPRAQSLLLQMSSLASKLFDVSPNRSLWSSSYRSNLPSFLNSPQSPQTLTLTSTKDILSLFTSLQTSLFESVSQLQEILDLQDSTSAISRQISTLDSSLRSFAKKIQESETVLDRLVDDYSDQYSLHQKLDLQTVLAYAHKISYTTYAPPEHGAGTAPLRGALPPAPQDNEMRASQLYHFADLDVGVPPKKKAKTATESETAVADEVLMEPTPPREELGVPMLPIALLPPPGWKKGMPVELPPVPAGWKKGDPIALPPVMPPAGWKPGDPVPLPPLEGKEEERQPSRGMPVQKAPEAIQVKYVDLEIPGGGDSSSEYSSEVGSSEEEEDEDD